MAKAAAIQLARVIAVENAEFGVRANALIVGAVATELSMASLVARGQDMFGPDWAPPVPENDGAGFRDGRGDDPARCPRGFGPDALRPRVTRINGAVIAIDRGFSAGAYNSAFVGLAAAGLLPG